MPSKMWEWIRRNLDQVTDVASVLGAAYLIGRYIWGDPKPVLAELSAGILAILSILAISGLVEKRSRLTRIESKILEGNSLLDKKVLSRVTAEELFQPELRLSEELFEGANEICISGITLGKTIYELTNVLSARLAAGAEVKVIVLAGERDALHQLVLRSFGKISVSAYRERLRGTMNLLSIVANVKGAKGSLAVGRLPYVPSMGIVLVDPNLPVGRARVEIYHHSSPPPMPSFNLSRKRDAYWYSFFHTQFSLMWETCSEKTWLIKPKGPGKKAGPTSRPLSLP